LQPGRTEAGYRVYRESDLETLEQIVALKFLGIPLKQIGAVLRRAAQLPDALRLQRKALEERHDLLGRAIRAIQAAEDSLASGEPPDPAILKKIIEVIDMQDGIAVMKKYYSEDAWERHKRYYEQGPSPEWRQLYRDGQALLGTDPGSEQAQALKERWFELSRRAYAGDQEVITDSPTAWMDREHWPPVMKQRMAEFKIEEVTAFIRLAGLWPQKRYFSDEAWDRLMKLRQRSVAKHSRMWRDRVDLFRDIEAALGKDPAGEVAQALVARWRAQLDEATAGDPEIKEAMLKGWAHRKNWPASMRWQVEALHMMSFDRFEKAADFLDAARGATCQGRHDGSPAGVTVEALLHQLEQEAASTRKLLDRLPEEKFTWKPHEKSFTLGKLANHMARFPLAMAFIVNPPASMPTDPASKAELVDAFDKRTAAAREALAATTEDHLAKTIYVSPDTKKTRALALQWMMNHMIHHRGQLTVYLRMLGVPVPGIYGPSADEKP
jgi:uncharacterized damage-inducible protein DinB/DNA-binding transcriptional MerR regulator